MLQPSVKHNFGGTIWRMEIDELTDTMVVEVRNETDKQVSFAAISLTSGKIYFENYRTDERWLTGVECVYDGVALLHYYKHESGPEHKGIMAINALTSGEIWSNYSHAFDHLTINGPAIYNSNLQPAKLLLADIKTGKVLRNHAEDDKPLPNSIVIPQLCSTDQLAMIPVEIEAVGNIAHYLHHNNYRIVSLHAFKNGVLQQHLLITDGATRVYADLLNSGIQKLQPEAFVLHKNALVYIKNKTEIIVLHL
ncbi:hypothetical protein A0256_13790 [Mucilaginibacter sp. PAMC 26640]|nr:hypothetical protein A0256_13790 [Mucilaginibacter sp. PAMC 26640]